MAIPEAVSLVLQAEAMSSSYGTYVLEMGRPVMIRDLAEKMLEIMGAKNVGIQYTGLRPGEKLQEELVEEGERRLPTDHPMVFRLLPNDRRRRDVIRHAERMLYHARRQDADRALELLYEGVPSYSTAGAPSWQRSRPPCRFGGPWAGALRRVSRCRPSARRARNLGPPPSPSRSLGTGGVGPCPRASRRPWPVAVAPAGSGALELTVNGAFVRGQSFLPRNLFGGRLAPSVRSGFHASSPVMARSYPSGA